MSRIVNIKELPDGDFYVGHRVHYYIRPEKLEELFDSLSTWEENPANILLSDSTSAIYYMNLENRAKIGSQDYISPIPMGVNYYNVPDFRYKIFVQDVAHKKGPWVLFRPPGSEEKTFFLQHLLNHKNKPEFQSNVEAPARIAQNYLHYGPASEIFDAFRRLGFTFSDESMTKEYADKVEY